MKILNFAIKIVGTLLIFSMIPKLRHFFKDRETELLASNFKSISLK